MSSKKIAVLVGSLRKDSLNRKMAIALSKLAPPSLKLEILEIGNLAIYNPDLDDSTANELNEFRNQIKSFDGVLFVTPEYNRSVPAVLKNALDVGSRPYGQSVWNEKPGAIISVSPGAIGGFGANHHLRQSLVFLNVPTLQQPEAYIGGASNLFDESGKIENESTRDFLKKFMHSIETWVVTNQKESS